MSTTLPRAARQAQDPFTDADRRHMRAAMALAERGRGTTRPNPVVGAVSGAGALSPATSLTCA